MPNKKATGKSDKQPSHQHNCRDTMKLVMRALDGELTSKEEEAFLQEVECCSHCLEKFRIEESFKTFLRSRLRQTTVPTELIERMKNTVRNQLQ